jgi:hypothetical protein
MRAWLLTFAIAGLGLAILGCGMQVAAQAGPAGACLPVPVAARPPPPPPPPTDGPVEETGTLSAESSRYETRRIGPPAPVATVTPVFRPGRPGATIDIDLKDADISDVCRLLADVGRVNIVVADDVHGKVTISWRRVPWDRALDVILTTKGLRAEREANVIVVRAK